MSMCLSIIDHMSSAVTLRKSQLILSVRGITVLCHFRKYDLMPVIICKNDKHLVTLYNVIFSYMTGILSQMSYIFY